MTVIVAGSIVIARAAASEDGEDKGRGDRTTTLLIAFGACFAYAALVDPDKPRCGLIGETETMWIGRWSGLAFIATILMSQRASVRIPAAWLPMSACKARSIRSAILPSWPGRPRQRPMSRWWSVRVQRRDRAACAAHSARAGQHDAVDGHRARHGGHRRPQRNVSAQPQTRPERTVSI